MGASGISPQIPTRTQSPCCYEAAMDDGSTYCDDCGKPLIRCMAFEECGGLLNDSGLCTVCIAPTLQIDAGAITQARIGGSVALPISIENTSAIGRPLFVTGLWSREKGGDWREEDLGWEKIQAGQARPAMIAANEIEKSGVHSIQVLLAISSRWRWRQECYAFSTNITPGMAIPSIFPTKRMPTPDSWPWTRPIGLNWCAPKRKSGGWGCGA